MLEVGGVLEGDGMYQGYNDRYLLKFPAHCQVGWIYIMNIYVYVCVRNSE